MADFPLSLNNINSLTAVDYDGSKNYRLLATKGKGDIYLYSENGKKLNAWFPKKTNTSLIGSPKHIRIGSNDFFLAIEKKGTINLLRRNGKQANGFPIKTGKTLQETYNYEKGSKLSNSFIRVLTKKGEYIKVTFHGKVSRQDLLKNNSSNESVEMVSNASHTDYVYLYRKGKNFTIKDRFLKTIYTTELNITSSAKKELYTFNNSKYVSVFNKRSQKAIINNLSSLSERRITSSTPVDIYRQGNRLFVASSNEHQIILKTYQ
ncbi:MAG: hypothetical protein AB8B61_04875 [Cyclobacteriaceae bacterium]